MYRVADTHNNAGGLETINPQPQRGTAMDSAQIMTNGSGGAVGIGYTRMTLAWNSLERDQYNSILTAFGLSLSVRSNEVTVRLRQNDNTFANFNATALLLEQPRPGLAFWSNLTILINRIEPI